MSEKCFFHTAGKIYGCGAMRNTTCDGKNTACGFYKTEQQYVESYNRAIEINRAKGRCMECKYREKPCQFMEMPKSDLEV